MARLTAVIGLLAIVLVARLTSAEKLNDDTSLESLTTLVRHQASIIGALQARLHGVETTVADMNSKVDHVSKRVGHIDSQLNTHVSFTAHMSKSPITVNDSPLLFDTVVSNVGNNYCTLTGVFTAPVSGHYFFYVQILNEIGTDRFDFGIFKGSQRQCANHLGGPLAFYNTASCLATVHLQKGDIVMVKRINDGTIIDGMIWSSFSGQLINADS